MKPIKLNEQEKELLAAGLVQDLNFINESIIEQEKNNQKPVGKRWKNRYQLPLITALKKIHQGDSIFLSREKDKMLATLHHFPDVNFDTTELRIQLGDRVLIERRRKLEATIRYYSNYDSKTR